MALDPKFIQALTELNVGLGHGQSPLTSVHSNPATSSLAHTLLTSGSALSSKGSFNPAKPSEHNQSVISRILDVVSRPLYATADAAYESEDAAANHESLWDQVKGLGTGVVHGLSGTQKRTWADVLQQGKDINDQESKTGSSAGYTFGQSGPQSTADKIAGVALNIVADPLNAAKPIEWARALGDSRGLYHIPTLGEVSKKAFSRNPVPSETIPPAEIQAELAAPRSTLLDVNPRAIANASSISDVLESKIGQPLQLTANHPHLNIDQEALANGSLRTTEPHLSPEGISAAQALHKTNREAFNANAAAEVRRLASGGLDPLKAASEYLKGVPSPKDASRSIHSNALLELRPDIEATLAHNKNWISEAVKNGVDPQRALQVVRDVQRGDSFKEAFADAVRQSKVFSGSRIPMASSLGKAGNGLKASEALRLSRILAPTPKEILDAVNPANPASARNLKTIEQAKALNAIRRSGAASSRLTSDEQDIANSAAELARNKIHGTGGFSPTGSYNDLAQSAVWNLIRGRVAPITRGGASNIRGLNERTLRIAAHVEDVLAKEGFDATSADGTRSRLTDAVLNNSEFPDKLNSYPNRIVNEYANGSFLGAVAKAEQAATNAAVAKPIIQSANLAVNNIFKDPALSDPVKHLLAQHTAKAVERSIMMNTGSSTAARAGRTIFKAIQDNQTEAPQAAIQRGARALTEIVSTGVIPKDYNGLLDNLMHGIEETLQTDPHSLSELFIPRSGQTLQTHLLDAQAAAEGGILGLLATWYGQAELRPAVVKGLNTARTNASVWANYWHDTFADLTQQQRIEAMRAAQGHFKPANPVIAQAADRIRSRFENLFSSTGLSEFARKGNTVAMRGGLIRDGKYGINAELKRAGASFRFTGSKDAKDMFGNLRKEGETFDLGTNWLNSWEVHKFGGEVPRELARIETAIFNYMAKKSIFDNISHYHGASRASEGFDTGIKDVPFLKGVYFSPDVAQQIPRVVRDLYVAQHSSSPMLRTLDNIMRMWKTGVTIYSPSHAIHNGLGDMYNNWIAGVNGVRPYMKAIKVMASTRDEYPTLERLGLYLNQRPAGGLNALPFGSLRHDERMLSRTASGYPLTASEIKMAAHNQGILQGVQHIEDIANPEGGIGNIRFQPFGGRVNAAAHAWVQGMDHFTRLAQFIHEIEKGHGSLQEIFDKAGATVRKYHPDGMDLTSFERNTIRRIIPFYSWTRKAIPFALEGMLTKPGKFMVYPKITTGINVGNAPNINPGQQFPSDQLFPSWITDEGIGPWGGPGGILNNFTGGPKGYVTGSLSIPPIDLLQTYGNHPNEGVLSGLNPLIKDPIELMQGQHLDTGIPITDPAEYAAETLPAVGLLSRLTNVGVTGTTPKGQQQGIGNQAALVNFLAGLKLTNTGQYIKQAQYELHQKQTALKKANRNHLQDFLKNVNGG